MNSIIWDNPIYSFMNGIERGSRNVAFLERRRPTEVKSSITDIDVTKYRGLGVNTLLLDAEGTIVEHDGWKIDKEVVQKIGEFRAAGFDNVVIVSNKKPKDERTFVKLNSWAQQIGADLVFTPESSKERKPHPDLLLKTAALLGIEPNQALMVGDKLTADIIAANDAGMYSVFVERRGEKDLFADKKVRRPFEERLLRKIEKLEDQFSLKVSQQHSVNDLSEEQTFPDWTENIDPKLLENSRIVNIGSIRAASVTVEDNVQLPFPGLRNKVREHYSKHGRQHADAAVLFRRIAGYVEGGLILIDKPDAARYVLVAAKGSDVYDGKAARADMRGVIPEGAVKDVRADRENSRATVLPAVVKKRLKSRHVVIRTAADEAKKPLREYYKKRGVDTKAGWPGKGAAAIEDAAEYSMLTEANPEWIQYTADAAKVASVPAYAVLWELQARKLERELPLFEEAKAALLKAAAPVAA